MSKQSVIIENLSIQIPTPLQYKYTIVPDQIKGKTFALAEINEAYKRSDYYTHTPITDFMSQKEMYCFLRGMQMQVRLFRNKKK